MQALLEIGKVTAALKAAEKQVELLIVENQTIKVSASTLPDEVYVCRLAPLARGQDSLL